MSETHVARASIQHPYGNEHSVAGDSRMPSGSSPAVGTQLSALLDQFLTHLRDFRDCAERTIESYREDADSFINLLRSEGLTTAEQVQRDHVHRYAAGLGHLAPATIRRRVYSLRSWFGHMVDVGILQTNPIASVQLPKRRPRLPKVPTEEQCDALLGSLSNVARGGDCRASTNGWATQIRTTGSR